MRYEDAFALLGKSVIWKDSRPGPSDGGEGTVGGTGRLIDVTHSHVVIEAFDGDIAKQGVRVLIPLECLTLKEQPGREGQAL